jgi:hypothetical protein
MLKCPVCGTENNDLNTVCVSCKGFIQAKVETLDLFSTTWGLVESPAKTFKRIALARSKNYVMLLGAAFGVALVFTYLWHWHMAVVLPSLVTLLGLGLLVGLPLGIILVFIVGAASQVILAIGKTSLSARNCRAVFAYATVPVVSTLIIVFPLEIAVFGQYFFDNNPPPLVINPVAYLGLIGVDAAAALWSVLLFISGVKSASGAAWPAAILTGLCIAGALVALVLGIRPV